MQILFHGGHHHLHGGGSAAHDHADTPGHFHEREMPRRRDLNRPAFTVGVGEPVGSSKTALMLQLCRRLRQQMSVAVVTTDTFTREDPEFLPRHGALEPERIRAVETGGWP